MRASEFIRKGIPATYLRRMTERGLLQKAGRGLYRLPDADISEHHSKLQVAARIPHGVLCLLSALAFHGIGTQRPHEVWIAIDSRARMPRFDAVKLRVFRFSDASHTGGIETYTFQGVPLRVYCAAKTVADCFKFRNKVGLDVAMEALRESLRLRKCTRDQIIRYAKICRVENVMRPYMQMESSG